MRYNVAPGLLLANQNFDIKFHDLAVTKHISTFNALGIPTSLRSCLLRCCFLCYDSFLRKVCWQRLSIIASTSSSPACIVVFTPKPSLTCSSCLCTSVYVVDRRVDTSTVTSCPSSPQLHHHGYLSFARLWLRHLDLRVDRRLCRHCQHASF